MSFRYFEYFVIGQNKYDLFLSEFSGIGRKCEETTIEYSSRNDYKLLVGSAKTSEELTIHVWECM